MQKIQVTYNSPVILTFSLVSLLLVLIDRWLLEGLAETWFSVQGDTNWSSPADWFRLFSHVIGHQDMTHLFGNLMLLLLVGPMLEEKIGSFAMLLIIAITAFVTGVMNDLVFDQGLYGASGVVFMLVILGSFSNFRAGQVPLTFILVALMFIGREVWTALQTDQVSQFAHIAGGCCGALFGFIRTALTPAAASVGK